jgi:dolichyl-phosphate beta-glucosyltransferase
MPRAGSLAIVLPAYNEADRIAPALDELFAYLDSQPGVELAGRVDVLVVDDGSTDGTDRIVSGRTEASDQRSNAGARLRVLSVPHGGKGAAVRAGILDVDADMIVFTDADMATPPEELPKLVDALRDHDVALGSRIQPDGSDMRVTQPGPRRVLGKAFHLLASLWAAGPIEDTQCGFKGFTREASRDLFGRQQITSIVFDVEIIYLARRRQYRIAAVPIRWFDKRGSRMSVRPGLALRVAWDLLRIPFIHRSVRGRLSPSRG